MTNQEADALRKSFEESDIVKYYNELGDAMVSKIIRSKHTMIKRNKSEKGRKTSRETGIKNKENGIFGTADSLAQQKVHESGWYDSERLKDIMRANHDPYPGIQALRDMGYYGSQKHIDSVKKANKAAHIVLQSKPDGYKNFIEAGLESSHKKITCDHCGEPGDLNNITRWHNDNCKEMPEDINRVLDALPLVFTEKEIKNAVKEYNPKLKTGTLRNILSKNKYSTKVYDGVYGSPINVKLYLM